MYEDKLEALITAFTEAGNASPVDAAIAALPEVIADKARTGMYLVLLKHGKTLEQAKTTVESLVPASNVTPGVNPRMKAMMERAEK